ncbi:hypothetical protein C4E24_06870 [ANME-1 cluster archaeon AG-394-G21]|nr:hypothetical protein [ANME-1 cluster archaeon AG-394-G21]
MKCAIAGVFFPFFIFLFIREYLRLAIQSNKMTTIEEILCRIEKGGTLDMLARVRYMECIQGAKNSGVI